ncbi:MAG: ATP-dependent DNA helicase [Deferrisomatales bacterium]
MELDEVFGEGGALARALPGYAPRPPQQQMAAAVARVLSAGGLLLAEAGTGTGKTLAYLAPAVLSRRRVVVSTATKTLQNQILEQDVPLLARALDRPVSAVSLKGRQNYLCLRRFEQFRSRPLFRFVREGQFYDRLERWAGSTQTGDRAELSELPDDYGPWREVCATSDTCWGARCPREADCHFQRHRRAAHRAQVVVVNHHLFFADLALRAAAAAEVLPRYAAVVFDEAHHLEAVATQYFGVQVSPHRVSELVRDAGELAAGAPALGAALAAVTEASTGFWAALPAAGSAQRLRAAFAGEAGQALDDLRRAMEDCLVRLRPREAEGPTAENLVRRAGELARDLARFAAPPGGGEVRWAEPRPRGATLHSAPVDVGPALEAALYGEPDAVVLTSATLRVGGSFEYLRSRLGIPAGAEELVVPSPFDYPAQGLLYVPRAMPDPNQPGFPARVAAEIAALLAASRGRAFCLFTSHRVLRSVAEALRGRLPYQLLVQGEQPREVLLREFRADVHSVLLGAQSFWEGVDVPGEALSAVIIDRIPFASPGDPLVESRIESLRNRGESPFGAYQLPAAAMGLRQGVGRLIRRSTDRGLVAVLDTRVLEKSYGRYLLASLPPFALTRDPAEVATFFTGP